MMYGKLFAEAAQTYVQSDEADMGMTYDELTVSSPRQGRSTKANRNRETFGRLRKVHKLGPFGMFQRLVREWGSDRKRGPDDDAPVYEPRQVAYVVVRILRSRASCLLNLQGEGETVFPLLRH
jgi:NAD+ synthase (glutamine-hydrolysing)